MLISVRVAHVKRVNFIYQLIAFFLSLHKQVRGIKIWTQNAKVIFMVCWGIKNLLHVILITIKNNDKIEVLLDDKIWLDSFVV